MERTELINTCLELASQGNDLRTGQLIFNFLPEGAQNAIRGTLFDPFHKNMDAYELTQWVQDHLVFGKINRGAEGVIAVFNGNDILWEAQWTLKSN